ncbi:MAG TPA: dienelactone hydrolase family protein [Jatrophihabitans sp.]|nr:dienelactone hydrolase family protein [Jatrophihabitans sp.]
MAEVVVFHHAQGRTAGVLAFAEQLRGAGHIVHTPDLYDGRTFDTLDEGLAYCAQLGGMDEIQRRALRVQAELPTEVVYAGMSLGVVPAQRLAQTVPGARGAIFLYSCLPTSFFGPWPAAVPVQVHGMDGDPFFADEGDLDAARALIDEAPHGELFLYPGDQHLFADSSLPAYDEPATELLTRRVLDFLREPA